MFRIVSFTLLAAIFPTFSQATSSVYTEAFDDAEAIAIRPQTNGVVGDGVADDTAALQAAIDQMHARHRRGLVFLAEGRYRLTHELQIWSGIRLIGHGVQRPVLFLAPHTPGYENGTGKYLVHFMGEKPERPDEMPEDANPGTFYSALSNVNLEIGPGNPAAVGVRAHFAQHSFLAHIDFSIGEGRAGIEEVGNEAEDLHFTGGDFGITTHKPSPSWPFFLADSSFTGQRRAAIETEEGGLTLIRLHISDTPSAISVRKERCEELWLEDSRLERVSGPAFLISEEKSARTQINLRNLACEQTPVLLTFRESGETVAAPASRYLVRSLTHGLQLENTDHPGSVSTSQNIQVLDTLPSLPNTDIPRPPAQKEWTNVRLLGAKGDGTTDDTAVLRKAVEQHRILYFPTGNYRLTDTLRLKPDTVLIGLNPTSTRLSLADETPAFLGQNAPAPDASQRKRHGRTSVTPPFPGTGTPKALVEVPSGGNAYMSGLGLDTGGINNRAVALKWSSGEHSLVNDVRFLGGHGTYGPDGLWLDIYNENHTGDGNPRRRWDSQYPSLWVTGGGGTFKGLWTPSTFASAGILVSDTTVPGRIYALSSEHHVRHEVRFKNVSHWRVLDLQTEEERGESGHALPLEIENCTDLLFANVYLYRVDTPEPYPTGIRVSRSDRIEFNGLHVYSPGKLSFDATVVDESRNLRVVSREVARLTLSGPASASRPAGISGGVQRLAEGFNHAEGAVADPEGNVAFFDQRWNTVYRWNVGTRSLETVSTAVVNPTALAADAQGRLLVVSAHGNLYSLSPGSALPSPEALPTASASESTSATFWLPSNRWRDSHDWLQANAKKEPLQAIADGGETLVPLPTAYLESRLPWHGWGTIDLRRAYQLTPAKAGDTIYVADEFGQTTWRFRATASGTLERPQRFAEEGEAGVTTDSRGRVYVCAGYVFVYDEKGTLLRYLSLPERPTSAVLGGKNKETLFITAGTSLYSWQEEPNLPEPAR